MRCITPQGAVSLLAGSYTKQWLFVGHALTQARFSDPHDVAVGPDGSVIAGQPRQRGFAPGLSPGVLAFPDKREFTSEDAHEARVGMRMRNIRLVMAMEGGVVEIGPLPR